MEDYRMVEQQVQSFGTEQVFLPCACTSGATPHHYDRHVSCYAARTNGVPNYVGESLIYVCQKCGGSRIWGCIDPKQQWVKVGRR